MNHITQRSYNKSKGKIKNCYFWKKTFYYEICHMPFFVQNPPGSVCTPLTQDKNTAFFSEFGFDHVPPIKTSLNICGFSDCFSLPSLSDPVKEKNKHLSVGIFERKNVNYICLNQWNHWRASDNSYKSISILQATIPGYCSVLTITMCFKQFTNNIKSGWLHVKAIKTELQRGKKSESQTESKRQT